MSNKNTQDSSLMNEVMNAAQQQAQQKNNDIARAVAQVAETRKAKKVAPYKVRDLLIRISDHMILWELCKSREEEVAWTEELANLHMMMKGLKDYEPITGYSKLPPLEEHEGVAQKIYFYAHARDMRKVKLGMQHNLGLSHLPQMKYELDEAGRKTGEVRFTVAEITEQEALYVLKNHAGIITRHMTEERAARQPRKQRTSRF